MIAGQIALVSETSDVPLSSLAPISAAIQKQVSRDFSPIWGIDATVDCFGTHEDVPSGYWHISIRDPGDPVDPNGIHDDHNGNPFAIVHARPGWSISVSHETLEILINPSTRRTVPGPSPDPAQGRVDFIMEVCDPCNAESYDVNGIALSDFCTPNYFDPIPNPTVRYCFTGKITQPRQILNGGYLCWLEPESGHLFRQSLFANTMQITNLGKQSLAGLSLRSFIYSQTKEAFEARKLSSEAFAMHAAAYERVRVASRAHSQALRRHVSKAIKKT